MNRLTKMPTTNSTWQKIIRMASSAGIDESLLERRLSSHYNGRHATKVEQELIRQEQLRMSFNQQRSNKEINEIKLDTFSTATPTHSSESLSTESNEDSMQNGDTESKKNESKEEASPTKKIATNSQQAKPRQEPVDALIGASLSWHLLKSDSLYFARCLFARAIPEITSHFNEKIESFPHIFKIPFLYKHHVLVLRTASRQQAEYLFNKALSYNPIEVLRPPGYRGGGNPAATAGAVAASNAAVIAAVC
jgi:hypothetical protein